MLANTATAKTLTWTGFYSKLRYLFTVCYTTLIIMSYSEI